MSDLVDFKIERVSGATVRARAIAVHPDAHDIPRSKNEAVQIILEGYRESCGWPEPYWPKPGCARSPVLDALVEIFIGRAEPIDKAEYDRQIERSKRGERLGFGLSMKLGTTYWKMHHVDVPRALAKADELIVEVHVEDVRVGPRTRFDSPDPEGTVVFTVRDPTLVAHLTPAMKWASAMYDLAIDLPSPGSTPGGGAAPTVASGLGEPSSAGPPTPTEASTPALESPSARSGCTGCAAGGGDRFPGILEWAVLAAFWLRVGRRQRR